MVKLMPGLPPLSCIPRLAANWTLQLHFSTDFQVILKATGSYSISPWTCSFFFSKRPCVAEFLLSPNYFTWLTSHKFNASLNCQPQNVQTSHIVKQCNSLKILQRIFQYSPSTSSQGIWLLTAVTVDFLNLSKCQQQIFVTFPPLYSSEYFL